MKEPANYAIVNNGVVTNVIWICPEQAAEFGAVLIDNPEAGIGWAYQGGVFLPPAESAVQDDG